VLLKKIGQEPTHVGGLLVVFWWCFGEGSGMVERDVVSASPCQGREEGERAPTPQWRFGPFYLDLASGCLWRDDTLVSLRPKPFALLAYLVAHAGQVVPKARLFEALWPETVVSEGRLKDYIKQIRQALGDTPRTPHYIATVHRRGYRFGAPVTVFEGSCAEMVAQRAPGAVAGAPGARSPARRAPGLVVAREGELAQLQQWWGIAQQGQRQLVLISGEAGIGKTTLVDAFVAQVIATQTVEVGYRQCIEQYGAEEAYLPLLEAFGRLGRGPDATRLVGVLGQYAPSWLVHLPALGTEAKVEELQHRSGIRTRERMLRGTRGRWRRDCACWPRPSRRSRPARGVTSAQKPIGSRVSCYCGRPSQKRRRPKPASTRRSPLPAASRPNPGSCGQP
jgi:DNA-binding winged helix-turn-helix (wHTH) protein